MARSVKKLYEISIKSSAEAEDPLAALLERVVKVPINIYADADKNISNCRAYLEKPLSSSQRLELKAGLLELKELELFERIPLITEKQIKQENWAESWKKHFKPLRIGGKLLVKPSWSKMPARKNEAVVILDPGLSFGTGNHPTTEFCLEALVSARSSESQNLLDAGCGSGILAIAAAKIGYSPVEAFDFDPEAVRIAKANAESNSAAIKLARKDLTKMKLGKAFDVVCANLIDDLLIAHAPLLATAVKPGGTLILAGILIRQYPAVKKAFASLGFREIASKEKTEWKSGAFRAPI